MLKKKISGIVQLSAVVDSGGNVRDIQVTKPVERSLDQQAIAALTEWRFEPATKDGQPVAVRLDIEKEFRLY